MLRKTSAALALFACSAPAAVWAQSMDDPAYDAQDGASLAELTDKLSDPERQRELALMVRAVSEVLLDMPIAPLVDAMGEITGEEAPSVEPDTTLRSLAPQASRVPEEIEQNLPHAMDAMSAMAGAMETMLPQLREMAEQFEETIPQDR